MTRTRLLRLEGDSSDHGQPHLEHTVGLVLAAARAGLMRPISDGTRRLFMDGSMETLVVVDGDGDRPAPDHAHVNRILVDALDRPLADRSDIDASRATMAAVAAFLHTDQEHVLMRTATPWQTPYACGCPCPFRGGQPHGTGWIELPFEDDLASLLPDVVCAVVDDGRLRLHPLAWGASLDPARSARSSGGTLPDIPDAMTALRTVRDLRSIRDGARRQHAPADDIRTVAGP